MVLEIETCAKDPKMPQGRPLKVERGALVSSDPQGTRVFKSGPPVLYLVGSYNKYGRWLILHCTNTVLSLYLLLHLYILYYICRYIVYIYITDIHHIIYNINIELARSRYYPVGFVIILQWRYVISIFRSLIIDSGSPIPIQHGTFSFLI